MTLVSSISSRPVEEISAGSRLSDLGFDSLMFVELATAIENAGGSISAPERFNEIQDIRELIGVVSRQANASQRQESGAARTEPAKPETDDEIFVPSLVKTIGNKGVDVVQR